MYTVQLFDDIYTQKTHYLPINNKQNNSAFCLSLLNNENEISYTIVNQQTVNDSAQLILFRCPCVISSHSHVVKIDLSNYRPPLAAKLDIFQNDHQRKLRNSFCFIPFVPHEMLLVSKRIRFLRPRIPIMASIWQLDGWLCGNHLEVKSTKTSFLSYLLLLNHICAILTS